jgi:hypothetical protein
MSHACLNLIGWVDAVKSEVDHIGGFLRQVTSKPGAQLSS